MDTPGRRAAHDTDGILEVCQHGYQVIRAIEGAASLPKIVPPTAEYGMGTYSRLTGRIWFMDNWKFLDALGPLSSHVLGGC